MSLSVAFNSATLGLQLAEKKIAVTASNINNADREGYTRKVYQTEYFYNGLAAYPSGGTVAHAVANSILYRQVIQQSTNSSYHETMSTYLSNYSQAMGSTAEGSTTLSSTLDSLMASLQVLEANGKDAAAKAKVVSSAQELASNLNTLSQSVQNQRLSASNAISNSVTDINESLKSIYELNRLITSSGNGEGVADLEDQRYTALQALSKQMGVQYFINDQNQAVVYANGATSLVSTTGYAQLSYNPVGSVTSTTAYPAGFSGIMLNGLDITNTLHDGTLGALVDLRDNTLPAEQAKLDALANTLSSTVNEELNKGSAYPPLATITSSTQVTSSTAFSGTGTMRVAVTDSSGVVQNYADINLATISPATVGGLLTTLNGISGISASINAQGYLEVSATSSSNRVAINPMNSNVGGVSASQFFGFNNLFVNQPNLGASTIGVNNALISNYNGLAIGTLSSSATLAAGDNGINSGDVSIVTGLIDSMKGTQSFAAAGNFSARTSSLGDYAIAIISDIASAASASTNYATTAKSTYTYLSDSLASESGVNLDEETANLTLLQTTYQANAQVMSVVRDLFQTIMQIVS